MLGQKEHFFFPNFKLVSLSRGTRYVDVFGYGLFFTCVLGARKRKKQIEFFPWLPMLSVHVDRLWYKKPEGF